jgi:NAD(P)-dependent dehydrogenase (short-subunit alcohol dehydrogenase family)
MTFKDKVVAITGAAGGIGQSLCRLFLDEGAKIALKVSRLTSKRTPHVSLTLSPTSATLMRSSAHLRP